MEARIVPDSMVYSETLPSYNALDETVFHHFRINHSKSFVKSQTPFMKKQRYSSAAFLPASQRM